METSTSNNALPGFGPWPTHKPYLEPKSRPSPWNGQTSLMLYKYTWTPSFKGTHSLITDLTFGEFWLTWASETLLQVTPPGSKLTCIDQSEANWGDSGLHGKVTLVSNSSYLFSAALPRARAVSLNMKI